MRSFGEALALALVAFGVLALGAAVFGTVLGVVLGCLAWGYDTSRSRLARLRPGRAPGSPPVGSVGLPESSDPPRVGETRGEPVGERLEPVGEG